MKSKDISEVKARLGVLDTLNLMIDNPDKVELKHVSGLGIRPNDPEAITALLLSLRVRCVEALSEMGVKLDDEK